MDLRRDRRAAGFRVQRVSRGLSACARGAGIAIGRRTVAFGGRLLTGVGADRRMKRLVELRAAPETARRQPPSIDRLRTPIGMHAAAAPVWAHLYAVPCLHTE